MRSANITPEVDLVLKNDKIINGEFIRGTFTIKGNSNKTRLISTSIYIYDHNRQNTDASGGIVGHQHFPFRWRLLQKDEIIEEEFEIKVMVKNTESSGEYTSYSIRLELECKKIDSTFCFPFDIKVKL